MVSVAYVDPGNFAANMSAGAGYGFLLLWVIVAANLIAMFVQTLSAKLGIATGQSLPALCRRHLPRPLALAAVVPGRADGHRHRPGRTAGRRRRAEPAVRHVLLPAAAITAVVSFGLLALAPHGRRRFELAITGLLAVVCAGFAASPRWPPSRSPR